ncbi:MULTISPECIES: hypothetical protein [Allobacillus]|uniref:ABC-2 family transporter protein n=1 Tax=Allobacillus halotolerans TaxID=570278 RepID=A0ABS6GMC2_9BACI|nr:MULTISPECIES: hypothetical protein [Allobacillus]MBU6080284.1 hypothetical protein [Allobacillus halotolerans]TSJ68486.1 hypothetical protein FPQ10_04695 [Allobacillus sp. SKP2-8]
MKNFFKLLNFELNRVMKLLISLMVFTLIVQLIGVFVSKNNYLTQVEMLQQNDGSSVSQVLQSVGYFSFDRVVNSLFFIGPIMICVAAIMFYIFLIWYRDWFGKNTFVYRLLMLPTARINLFFAKLTTILLATFSLVGFQLVAIQIEMLVMKWTVPSEYVMEVTLRQLIEIHPVLSLIAPNQFSLFMSLYGVGVLTVIILFTAILLERSYRMKGVLFGGTFVIAANLLVILPVILNETVFHSFLYNGELLLIVLGLGVIVLASSVWLSKRLLDEKIRV